MSLSLSCGLRGGAGGELASLPREPQLSRKASRWPAPGAWLSQAAMFIGRAANGAVPGAALMPPSVRALPCIPGLCNCLPVL